MMCELDEKPPITILEEMRQIDGVTDVYLMEDA